MKLLRDLFSPRAASPSASVRLCIEAMLLMIAADGVVEEQEMDRFVQQVHARAELREIPHATLDGWIYEAFANIRREGVAARVRAIAAALPEAQQRVVAFSMALAVAAVDGRVAPGESALITQLRQAFELSDAEVEIARRAAGGAAAMDALLNAPLAAPLGSPEPLYIETLLLMAAADGVLEPRELERFGAQLAEHVEFRELTPDAAAQHLDRALRNIEREGVEARIQAIAEGLGDEVRRATAFRMAIEMCVADGDIAPHERTLLRLLQTHLQLSDDLVREQLHHVLGTDTHDPLRS